VVRNITDITHPSTVGSLGAVTLPQFASATSAAYTTSDGLVRVPFVGSPKSAVANGTIGPFVWSPDGSSIAFLSVGDKVLTLHQIRAGTDTVLGQTPGLGVGGCEAISSCAIANSLDSRLAYSPDGAFISFVGSGFAPSVFRLWSTDGRLVKSIDSQDTTMSTWSGQSLYFRDDKGVEVWRDGTVSSFLPGVAWIKPHASPGGGKIVYTARDTNGWAHSYVVDTATRTTRELKSERTGSVFLTSRYVWYEGERSCTAADTCGAQPPWHPLSGKTYIYDLQDGTETESIIASVLDSWPHPA